MDHSLEQEVHALMQEMNPNCVLHLMVFYNLELRDYADQLDLAPLA